MRISLSVYTDGHGWADGGRSEIASIAVHIDNPPKGKILNEEAVKKMVQSLNLNKKEMWRDCWQDEDSPQSETTFGVRKAA